MGQQRKRKPQFTLKAFGSDRKQIRVFTVKVVLLTHHSRWPVAHVGFTITQDHPKSGSSGNIANGKCMPLIFADIIIMGSLQSLVLLSTMQIYFICDWSSFSAHLELIRLLAFSDIRTGHHVAFLLRIYKSTKFSVISSLPCVQSSPNEMQLDNEIICFHGGTLTCLLMCCHLCLTC